MKRILRFLDVTSARATKFLVFGCIAILIYRTSTLIAYDVKVTHAGFYIPLTLAYIFLLIGVYIGFWVLFTKQGKQLIIDISKEEPPKNNIKRLGKVLFACWGITVGGFIIITVCGLFLFGQNFITNLTESYSIPILLILMII